MPRLLRGHFAGRPARLGELALAAHDAITAWLRERTGCPAGQPGLVMVVQTFGDFLLWHVPAKGVPSVRYYGWYSNKSRGLRRKATAASTTAPAEPKPPARRRRVRWRELIRQVWGADPLRCPLCSGFLRPIEWIETPTAIRAFLEPLGLYESTTGPPAQAPPIDAAALIEAVTGEAYPAGPQPEPKWLEHPRIKTDPLYYRQWMLPPAPADHDECWQPDAEADFDQAGFELPPWRAPATDPGQGSLFPEYAAQSDSSADEPVFVLTGRQSEPEDDYIQPDAPDDVRP